jgi:major type 1 subunit fimbrin (pilin)
MKNSVLSLALAAGMVMATPAAFAADGKLTFTGLITGATCTVTGSGAASGTGDITVGLDTYAASEFDADGSDPFDGTVLVGEKPFKLVLAGGTDCANGKVYSMQFRQGAPNADTNGNLNNADVSTEGAKNVQIRVLSTNGYPINFYTDANAPATGTIAGNQGEMSMVAAYVAKGAAPTPGNVQTSVEFVLTHN